MAENPDPRDAQDTRTRLLRTALKAFGERDFEAVSVRAIVAPAGANIAAVSYHFGGKQGLYLATASFLADALHTRLGPLLADIERHADDASPRAAARLLRALVRGLVQALLANPLADQAAGFVLREQQRPSAAFDVLYQRLMLPVHRAVQRLLRRLPAGTELGGRTQILVSHAPIGQILAFRSARSTVLRRLDQREFRAADIELIAEQMAHLTLRALGAEMTGEDDDDAL